MAEITQSETSGNRSSGRLMRKSSVKLDMTPMVDLAFLLLTFFVLTTTLNEAHVVKLAMPPPSTDPAPISEKRVLTLLLGKGNSVYWYPGITPALNATDFNQLRKFLLGKKASIPDLVVLVKASDHSRYQNVIDVLDEFLITGIDKYFIVDITDEETQLLEETSDVKG